MIVTREWLSEWIDISDISTQELVTILNRIGLEVAEVQKIDIPQKVVLGRVVSCQKHPDANKLSVCQVDIGSETLQIVCGAANVKYAHYVAVAKIGAVLPQGLEIKPAKLRGVESYGMLCSSTELGLPKMEEGIMLLDESIGPIELGKELRDYPIFQDEIIDIELTANRGDCLSVAGVARELGVALGRDIKEPSFEEDNSFKIGIGRILNIDADKDIEANLLYKAFGVKSFSNPFLMRLRVALTKEQFRNRGDEFAFYITHSTGVITRSYGYRAFQTQENPLITLKKDEEGFDAVYGKSKASIVGIYQFEESMPEKDEEIIILEASFIDPELISKKMFDKKVKSDWAFYRSSRGSDPRLSIAMAYAKNVLSKFYKNVELYAGMLGYSKEIEKEAIKIDFEKLDALVGQQIERSEIVEILKALGFTIQNVSEDGMVVKTPIFRHDIKNLQDVAEEIVRIYGIDNIVSKPLAFVEANRINDAYRCYKEQKLLRERAIANGFFETLSFVFTDKEFLQKYGFTIIKEEKELINPITNTLNTLRTSLVPNLIQQTQYNLKNGQRRIKLFEIGTIFDKERNEKSAMALIVSGWQEPDWVDNHGKPKPFDIGSFIKELAKIFGDFELRQSEPLHSLMHPYQCGVLYKGDSRFGYLYKVPMNVATELELPDTFIAEIDLGAIKFDYPQAKPYSIYQLSIKDLSIVVDEGIAFSQIKEVLQNDLPKEVKRFYPVDIYSDESMAGQKSVTLRFAIQSDYKTLTEEEIGEILQAILQTLEQKIGAKLR